MEIVAVPFPNQALVVSGSGSHAFAVDNLAGLSYKRPNRDAEASQKSSLFGFHS